jgi:hypothetical protein
MCHIRNNFVAYCVCDFLVLKLHQENVWPVKNFNWKLLATEKKNCAEVRDVADSCTLFPHIEIYLASKI